MVYQPFNKIGGLWCTASNFTENGVHVTTFWRSVVNSDVWARKPSWWKLLFSKVDGLESFPLILLKPGSIEEISRHGLCKIPLYGIFFPFFTSKVIDPYLQIATLLKLSRLEYIVYIYIVYRANFYFERLSNLCKR